ncbi:MAG TPA: glycogen debranching enzyme N-terminal domain-containing protein, partial [Thermoanaerobaculia bacterium]|nr:glycogen debranching enzyme N-terminal domain-containing protein [Thermoanaerobaculia bacterium]
MTAIPSWEFGREICADFERSSRLEWLEGNGLGGWASSTVSGAHTRRYHGLLVAATEPPVGRKVLLSRLDETVVAGSETFELGASRYPGAVHPQGFRHLMRFAREPFPTFDFEIGPARLRKTIAAVHGENATLVLYELLAADAPVRLTLRPFFSGRDFHALGRANDFVRRTGVFEDGTFRYASYDGVPAVFVHVPGGAYAASPDWYYRFQYDLERERGLDFEEDLFTPGTITVDLAAGERLGVLISTEPPAGRDAWDLAAAERARREGLLERFGNPDPFCRALALAADAFLVRRDETLSTVIAGYPWFSDWGRDAMIALPGLCLVTRRFDEAKGILRAFANAASEGMLPNRFPDASPEAGGRPEYNTADATLWLFVAAWRYFEATADGAFVRDELMPVLKDVLAWHERGTRHGIRVEPDGLLHAGEPGVQLTWMDAKVGDWVVTPRTGKPVEIQALWANALAIFAELA